MPEINLQEKRKVILDFYNNNKRLSILICIMIVVIIAAILINIYLQVLNEKPASNPLNQKNSPSDEKDYVEILPKIERLEKQVTDDTGDQGFKLIDPFMGPKKVIGVILGGSGEDLAIIKIGNGSYLVQEGQTLENGWNVKEITGKTVHLVAGEKESILNLTGASVDLETKKQYEDKITIDVQKTDVRDLLSALAIKTDTNVFLLEKPHEVNFSVKNVSPMKALQLAVQNEGWIYLQDGKLIIVGSSEKMHESFYNQMVLTRFNLMYITSEMIEPLISKLGLPAKIVTIETNSQSIWIQGTPQTLTKMQELIAAIDRPENATEVDEDELAIEYREITTNYISPQRVVDFIQQAGISFDSYITLGDTILIFEKEVLESWNEFERLIAEVDNMNSREFIVFDYDLDHTYAKDAAERLDELGYESVKAITFNFAEFGREIIVISPSHLKQQVIESLDIIDKSQERIKAPIAVAKGEHAKSEIRAKRELLSEMTGIDEDEMNISDNLSGDSHNPHYVLWIKDTPDNIQKLRNLVQSFDG